MKNLLPAIALFLTCSSLRAAKVPYIPAYWSGDPHLSAWSYDRSHQSENFILFWGPDAGLSPATNPSGTSLHFNPAAICDTLEYIYRKYIQELHFCSDTITKPLGRYKIPIIMTNTWGAGGPDGFAYATLFDGVFPGMFVDAGATLDGGVTSHEFAHCLQFLQAIQENPNPDGAFRNNPSGFFYETHANFMRNQIYPRAASYDLPRWIGTGMFHWSSTRHHYDAYQLLFHIQRIDGIGMVNRLWSESLADEHPLMTYRRLKGWTQKQLDDFIYDYASRQVIYDYPVRGYDTILRAERERLKAQEPHYLWRQYTMLHAIDSADGRYVVPDAFAPQDYGFNIIPLYPTCDSRVVWVKFKGHTEVNATAGWRYGFVATNSNGTLARYDTVHGDSDGELSFQLRAGESHLYFVVVGAPTSHTSYLLEPGYPRIKRYPYELRIAFAKPEGYQDDFRAEYKTGGHRHSNGGGWVSNSATVAPSVFVGPRAIVRGKSRLSGNVVIDGTAWVEEATAGDSTVINGNASVTGGSYAEHTLVTDNAVLNAVASAGHAIFRQDALEFGGTFGGDVVVGGDAEVAGCTTGVYLQFPDYNNGRSDCDGRGAADTSNIDINAPYAFHEPARMSFSGRVSCDDLADAPREHISDLRLSVYPLPLSGDIILHCGSGIAGDAHLEIVDMNGQIVLVKNITIPNGIATITVPFRGFAKGAYIVTLAVGERHGAVRIVN